ncbi:putative secreted protein [Jannaschia seosinensis]|uniref:Putative secreted protein n=1 Tax=Jannaschia seosinensis TaxID=313367 RepID=A0A0M7BAD8_9RHOB|nr:DUF1467 family protein [Jannaschia seosinensis]CUH39159.1 putative secreted protein [Jannaschia seosinensis]
MIGFFSGFVLFAMVWAMIFLISLQIGQDTQGDRGARLHGTHASSPEKFRLGPRMLWVTVISLVLSGLLIWLILSGLITIEGLRTLTGRPAQEF